MKDLSITLRKTVERRQTRFGPKGKLGVTPASYDIYADGKKVGSIMGGCHSRLACKSGYQKGEVMGKSLRTVGFRGEKREQMEREIRGILEKSR